MAPSDSAQFENLQQVLQAYQAGDLPLAYQLCKGFLEKDSKNIPILQFTGLISIELGYFQDAITVLSQAVCLAPNDPFLMSALAQAYENFGQLTQAVECYQNALGIEPACIEALVGLAPLLQQQKRYADAEVLYRAVLGLEPGSTDVLSNLGSLYLETEDLEKALACFNEAVVLNPAYAQAYYNMSFAYRKLQQLENAKTALEKAIQYSPKLAEAYFQLGIVYKLMGNYDDELACYEQAVAIDPENIALQSRLAGIYSTHGEMEKTEASYRALCRLEPDNPLWVLRLSTLMPIVAPDKASILQYRESVKNALESLEADSALFNVSDIGQTFAIPPYHWLYQGVDDTALRSRFADYLAQRMGLDGYAPKPLPLAGRKIKVGFLCTEHRENSFWVLQHGFIEKLDKGTFDVAIIGTAQTLPELKKRVASDSDIRFIDLPIEIPDIVEKLRQECLDVIHFFEVGSDPKNYFLPFYRMAPVQCTSWGILSTTGIPNMDYYLSSVWFEPEDAQAHYREKLIRLDSSLAYYDEPKMPDVDVTREQLGLPTGKTLYVCPHSLFKIQPAFDDYLKGILEKDPNGVVVLNENGNDIVLADVKSRISRTLPGLHDRIVFLPYLAWPEYVGLLKASDVLLDPIDFGGGVTSYNAFSLGLPVVTHPSPFLRGRVTYGMYRMMGIDDCIADSKDAYVEKCVEIANNLELKQFITTRILERKHALFRDEAMPKALAAFFVQAVQNAI